MKLPPVSTLAQYWKAIIGFFAPAIVILGSALLTTGHITKADLISALVTAVVTATGVALKGNADAPPPADGKA